MKPEFGRNRTFETMSAMFDRLLEVGLDRPHGDTEALGDFAMRQALDSRESKHHAPALGKFCDRPF
jgi:hypothetical protein